MELVVDDLHPGTDETNLARCEAGLPRSVRCNERRPASAGRRGPAPGRRSPRCRRPAPAHGPESASKRWWWPSPMVRRHTPERVLWDVISLRRVAMRRGLPSTGWVVAPCDVQRLRFPDGAVAEQVEHLTDVLGSPARSRRPLPQPMAIGRSPRSRCERPRRGSRRSLDPRTCARVFGLGLALGNPGGCRMPWRQCRRLDLERRQTARKRWATYAFTSQIRPLGSDHGGRALLADSVLRRFWRPFEVFIETESMTSTSRSYFEQMYRDDADPWEFESSPYEQRKYAVTVASLPRSRYRSRLRAGMLRRSAHRAACYPL